MNEGGGLISRAGAGLPQKTKISELDNCVKSFEEIFKNFDAIKELKDMIDVNMKFKGMLETLKTA
jgi:hypothetical protein